MPDAFYSFDGEGFISSDFTRGPWSAEAQHGSPPAALLMRAITKVMRQDGVVARFVLDFLKTVPVAGRLRIRTEILQESRQTQRVRAALWSGDREVAQATALILRLKPLPVPAAAPNEEWPSPESVPSFVFNFFAIDVGYHRALDSRIVRGTWGQSPIDAWLKPTVQLVLGEVMSPIERVMAVVDAQNGVAPALDIARSTFINPDLTVYFARPPQGAWVGLRASSAPHEHGVGLVQSELHDEAGVFGRALQSLLLDKRA